MPLIGSLTADDSNRSGDEILPHDSRGELRSLALKMVTDASQEPNFLKRPRAGRLLFSWARLSSPETVSEWLKVAATTNDAVLELARIIPGEVHSSNDGRYYVVDREAWSKLLDVDDLSKRIEALRDVATRGVVERFQEALARRDD